ncbi:MAG: hypothetical protein IIX57_04075 [Lachnospiraceae bacterium]|nr:hypothetical protein [Lachnospiraceae bacterium]
MENNELMMNEEFEVMDDAIMEEGGSGIGAGVAMLIGAGLTLAVGAGVKLGKKAIAAYKAKKELRQPVEEIIVEPEDIEELASKE